MKPRHFEGYEKGPDGLQRKIVSFGKEKIILIRNQAGELLSSQPLSLRQVKEVCDVH